MSDPACPSCGTPYDNHLSLHGTCAALLEARRERDEARAERDILADRLAANERAEVRITRIKAIREATGLGLREAKQVLDAEAPHLSTAWTIPMQRAQRAEAERDEAQRERDEARAKVAETWLAGVAEGRRCATLSAEAEAEERDRALLEAHAELAERQARVCWDVAGASGKGDPAPLYIVSVLVRGGNQRYGDGTHWVELVEEPPTTGESKP